MPNVSKAEWDRVQQELSLARRDNERLRSERQIDQARLGQVNVLFEKIVKAARGLPIIDRPLGSGRVYMGDGEIIEPGWGFNPHSGEPINRERPGAQERAEGRETALHDELRRAESRLSAVVAIAETAQEHKA